jgi:transcriptional regulator with XRE-family HTH domain
MGLIVRNMETAPKLGEVGLRVAANVKSLREDVHHFSVRELSARLADLGRPILPSGITKIEQGLRRVDADDLVALAAALETSPGRLMFDDDVEGLYVDRLEELEEAHPAELKKLGEAVNTLTALGLSTTELVDLVETTVTMRRLADIMRPKQAATRGAKRGKRTKA